MKLICDIFFWIVGIRVERHVGYNVFHLPDWCSAKRVAADMLRDGYDAHMVDEHTVRVEVW